jgi:hypothetical protein
MRRFLSISAMSLLPCAAVAHNNDFVIAFTKLDKTLPRTDFFGEAIALVVAAVRNVDFQVASLFLLHTAEGRVWRRASF